MTIALVEHNEQDEDAEEKDYKSTPRLQLAQDVEKSLYLLGSLKVNND